VACALTHKHSIHYPFNSFKSRNADKNPRYTPRTIEDVSKASPVEGDTLQNFVVSVPQPRKTKTSEIQAAPKKVPGPTTSSSSRSSNTSSNKKREKSDPKIEKDLFDKTFKIVTMTMGSLTCCLRRATSLNKEQAQRITERLDEAVHVFSRARNIAFKALENYIYLQVTKGAKDKQLELEPVEFDPLIPALDLHESAEQDSLEASRMIPPKASNMAPLDLILDRAHGTTVVRNLVTLLMNGGDISHGGAVAKAPEAIDAQQIAKEIHKELCLVFPDLEAVNPKSMPLGVPLMELAVNIHSAIRTHFHRLPGLIVNKVIHLCQGVSEPEQEVCLGTNSIPDPR
jgi:hypothetical protein